MSGRSRRGLWGWNVPFGASLLPRIIALLLLVLTVSVGVTAALSTRLTRIELQEQARRLLRDDLGIAQRVFVEGQSELLQGLRNAAAALELEDLDDPARRNELTGRLDAVKDTLHLDLLHAIDPDGRSLVPLGPGLDLDGPPRLADLRRGVTSVIAPTVDGRYAQVSSVSVGSAEDRFVLVGGRMFDDGLAYDVRRFVGHDVFLVVDGELVGSTTTERLSRPPEYGSAVVEGPPALTTLDGVEAVVDYVPISGGDGPAGALGIAVPDPVSALEQALMRTRALAILFLVVLGLILGTIAFRRLTRPILELAGTAQRIAQGDLDHPFEVDSRDEIGELAGSLERMRRSLRTQLDLISQQADALQASSKRIVTAQDEERRRLAGDLHDGVQQQLVMLRMRVGFARAALPSDPDQIEAITSDLADEIDRIITRLRDTSQDIFPSILRDRGLSGAIYSLAGRAPVTVRVRCEPDPLPRFDATAESHAYFLIAEAVSNALKHGQPSNVDVRVRLIRRGRGPLDLDRGRIQLRIVDDGGGFDAVAVREAGGLARLRDRVIALGGWLRVRSTPGSGTRVEAAFPLDGAGPLRSVVGPLEVEQDGSDPPVQVDGLGEAELAEDGVGVFLDRALGDDQFLRDGRVASAGRHEGEDLELSRRETGES